VPAFTVADEYVPHAVAAIGLLRQHPAVDAGRIFALGHSQGGTVAPRVAAAEPSVAGLVVLAAGMQPLHWAAVGQMRYLASLAPETAGPSQAAVDALTEQARAWSTARTCPRPRRRVSCPSGCRLRNGWTCAPTGRSRLPRRSASRCSSSKAGRDYQVTTVADDLTGWEAELAHCPDVTIKVYPSGNHFSFPGSGRSAPAEYEPPSTRTPAVVADIADWLVRLDERPMGPAT
jgi:pimeloyl-ACP methyl ester carboxylesterase